MTKKRLSFPKQWEDWASWILGIWLSALPLGTILRVRADCSAQCRRARSPDYPDGGGRAVGLSRLGRVDQHYTWNLARGFPLGSCDCEQGGAVDTIVVGALVLVLALHEIRNMRSDPDEESN